MSTKHQTNSFRTINGQKWMCEADVFTAAELDAMVSKLNGAGRRTRYEYNKAENYWRIFASPEARA